MEGRSDRWGVRGRRMAWITEGAEGSGEAAGGSWTFDTTKGRSDGGVWGVEAATGMI
jgi:hypothetical protein